MNTQPNADQDHRGPKGETQRIGAAAAASWIGGGHRFERGEGRGIFYRREGKGGTTMVMLHGFPTWSYDYVDLVPHFTADHEVIAFDFHGYGASDKPRDHQFTVAESADTVESLLSALGVPSARLVIHDYGGIVGQELLDRRRLGRLSFKVEGVHLMNCGVVFEQYRPHPLERMLASRVIGKLVASLITKQKVRAALDAVRGPTHHLSDELFEELWYGIARNGGHKLFHRHIRVNQERALHAARWLSALEAYDGPLHLIWGLADPVSGTPVLDALRPLVPNARVDALPGVGHFPMSEAPASVAAAIRGALQ
jgi:pimeloyl-ACP methyl ester carboxylesterase